MLHTTIFSVEIFSHSKAYSPNQHSNLPFLHKSILPSQTESKELDLKVQSCLQWRIFYPATSHLFSVTWSFNSLLTQEPSNLVKNQLHLSSLCTLYGNAITRKELMGGGELSPPWQVCRGGHESISIISFSCDNFVNVDVDVRLQYPIWSLHCGSTKFALQPHQPLSPRLAPDLPWQHTIQHSTPNCQQYSSPTMNHKMRVQQSPV